MYKTTSKGMQKAWGREIPRKKPIIRSPRAKATADELRDFNTGQMPQDVLLDQLRPVIQRLRRDMTNPRPGQLAKLLNAKGLRTAQGRRWDERKVILLLRLMAEQSARRRASKAKAAPAPKSTAPASQQPLNADEVARRLSAVGRVKS